MSQESRARSRNTASILKARKIERTHGACPWGCGAQLANGGDALLRHLNICTGNHKKDSRRGRDR